MGAFTFDTYTLSPAQIQSAVQRLAPQPIAMPVTVIQTPPPAPAPRPIETFDMKVAEQNLINRITEATRPAASQLPPMTSTSVQPVSSQTQVVAETKTESGPTTVSQGQNVEVPKTDPQPVVAKTLTAPVPTTVPRSQPVASRGGGSGGSGEAEIDSAVGAPPAPSFLSTFAGKLVLGLGGAFLLTQLLGKKASHVG